MIKNDTNNNLLYWNDFADLVRNKSIYEHVKLQINILYYFHVI
jgi:hypothetical protein